MILEDFFFSSICALCLGDSVKIFVPWRAEYRHAVEKTSGMAYL